LFYRRVYFFKKYQYIAWFFFFLFFLCRNPSFPNVLIFFLIYKVQDNKVVYNKVLPIKNELINNFDLFDTVALPPAHIQNPLPDTEIILTTRVGTAPYKDS
jgi:hypothetical protein